MGSLIAHMAMSLDGFIASLDDQVGPLFDWYEAGEVATPTADERLTFHTDPASADAYRIGARFVSTDREHQHAIERFIEQ